MDVPIGDPRKRLSYAAIEDKFGSQAAYALPNAEIDRLIARVRTFESLDDVSGLFGQDLPSGNVRFERTPRLVRQPRASPLRSPRVPQRVKRQARL